VTSKAILDYRFLTYNLRELLRKFFYESKKISKRIRTMKG
jgi:hypothetical protein